MGLQVPKHYTPATLGESDWPLPVNTPQIAPLASPNPYLTAGKNWSSMLAVKRTPNRSGEDYLYGRPANSYIPVEAQDAGTGNVPNSLFQPFAMHWFRAARNYAWYDAIGGYPRNFGLTFKVGRIDRGLTGPGGTLMRPKRAYDKVQRVSKANASPGYYLTRGLNGQ